MITAPRGAKLVCFDDKFHRDAAVARAPIHGRFRTFVSLDKPEDTDNRFRFEHEAMAYLSFDDYPLEHWFREHIAISTVPFANIHLVDPICITGYDYSNVFVSVKAEDLLDIPNELRIKNYGGLDAISPVKILNTDPIPPVAGDNPGPDDDDDSGEDYGMDIDDDKPLPQPPSSGPPSDPGNAGGSSGSAGHKASSAGTMQHPVVVNSDGSTGMAAEGASDASMPGCGMLLPVPCGPFAGHYVPPTARGTPITSRPSSVVNNVGDGFVEISVKGQSGEEAFFKLPLQPW